MMLGAGEGKSLTAGRSKAATVVKTRQWNVFDNKKRRKSVWQNKLGI